MALVNKRTMELRPEEIMKGGAQKSLHVVDCYSCRNRGLSRFGEVCFKAIRKSKQQETINAEGVWKLQSKAERKEHNAW